MTSLSVPTADAAGVRGFGAQSELDRRCTPLFQSWFEQHFGARCDLANKKIQLRGVDLCVRLKERAARLGPVGVDLKIDTYDTGNITFEIISQCRGHALRDGPAPGWYQKDMPWVAYYFLQTGETIFLDMAQVHPWLDQMVADLMAGRPTALPSWAAAVPNRTYQTYNLVARIADVLAHCPGAFYVRLTATPETFLIPNPPADRHLDAQQLMQRMQGSGCYCIKPLPEADDVERRLRWFEANAVYSRKAGVRERGLELQRTRPRRPLPEDTP